MPTFKFSKAPEGEHPKTFDTWEEADDFMEDFFKVADGIFSIERTTFGNGSRQINLKDVSGKIIYQIKEK